MSLKLYELTGAYQNIADLVDDDNPDLDLVAALSAIEDEIEIKAVNIANLIKSIDAEAQIIKAEEERLKKRREARENTVVRVKTYLQEELLKVSVDKVKTATRTIWIQSNPPSCEVVDEKLIPLDYKTHVPESYAPRVKDIIAAWKEGKEVPGVKITQGKGIRIR
ncbi:siphovirus Gp157 family protein [Desulfitobacterium chlororespirans]|uniref:Virus Gp157 n=1 Tax=Desulfitobacterium chlororespirans DSM 11544 TaxID=1121395 RepID=A0A1M7U3I9_9FIRM|nr:siphovirus Gp157 family protein [Desulfitobacterium chlororespirans]SHN77516.1 virus Gp157 [Desulfitobacterium chlororespirans DSM 11544]